MASQETGTVTGRDWIRLALVGTCILAIVVAALLVPVLAGDGLAGTPIDSILPGERFESSESTAGGGSGAGQGFGALHPGDTTGVGGETGFDDETFASNDTEVHFEVESSQPAYWRTGAYDTYTGSGWIRTGEAEPYQPPLETSGLTAERVEFDVTLAKPASALPTVWQPRRISGVEGLERTAAGGLRTVSPVAAGTTISGTSLSQEDSVDVLRAAGDDYPDRIEEQYTALPGDTPSRVADLTDELTADDETAYDAATTIQNWLRSEKEYSLEASRRSDSIADTFIFEMEAGYCEYFATAMTTMLRTQDIPARYTVGYTTGQPIDNNTYEVRGMNAHAWVEVYFPEVGWVKFDPTPGGDRLESQSAVLDEEVGEDFDLQEAGSPGELFEPGEIREREPPDDNDTRNTDGSYDIALNRTAVPGFPVQVLVTEGGEPVPGAELFFNGESVGRTDDDGTVVGTVPDAEELRITVNAPEERNVDRGESTGGESTGGDGTAGTGEWRAPPGPAGGGGITDAGQADSLAPTRLTQEDANTTYPIETGATVTVSGDVLPGQDVTVTATVADVAIPAAVVSVDGERVGTTDSEGRATVVLPDEPGEVPVRIERNSIAGETTVTIPELQLTVDVGRPLPLTTATVEVTAGDRTVAGAPVVVDGERVATTGPDGTADIRLPLANSAVVETSRYGMTDRATVEGLLVNLALLIVAPLVFVVVPAWLLARRGYGLSTIADRLAGLAATLLASCRRLLVGIATSSPGLSRAVERLRAIRASVHDVVRGRVPVSDLRAALGAWLAARRAALARRLGPGAADESGPARADAVRQAWDRFLTHVSVADAGTHTPGELAAHAVERDGYPPEAVGVLRDAFREVEYGSRPASERVDRVREAIERIERHESRETAPPSQPPTGWRRPGVRDAASDHRADGRFSADGGGRSRPQSTDRRESRRDRSNGGTSR